MGRPKLDYLEPINVLTLRMSPQDRQHLDLLAQIHSRGNTSGLVRRVLDCFLAANPPVRASKNQKTVQKIGNKEVTGVAAP
jgi:hypothetical protein